MFILKRKFLGILFILSLFSSLFFFSKSNAFAEGQYLCGNCFYDWECPSNICQTVHGVCSYEGGAVSSWGECAGGGGSNPCAGEPGTSNSCVPADNGYPTCRCCPNGTTLQSDAIFYIYGYGGDAWECGSGNVRLGSYCNYWTDGQGCYWTSTCQGYACTSQCNVTAPTNVTTTETSATSATVNWTPGANGTKQMLFVGADPNLVSNNCVGSSSPACVVNQQDLSASANSYATGNVLVPGTVYYAKVVNYKNSGCTSSSASRTFVSSCTLSPTSVILKLGGASATLTTPVNNSSAITSVNYSSDNSGVASVNPLSDTTYVYQTSISPVALGNATVTSNVIVGGSIACTGTVGVTVTNPDPWWQVIDSDISAQGDVSSAVPAGGFFGLDGAGGYPGIPSYSGTTDLTSSNVNSLGWIAQSSSIGSKIYDYNFFASQVPSDVVFNSVNPGDVADSLNTPGSSFYGYEWYKYVGPGSLNINTDINFGSRKVVLFVENGSLVINSNINLTDGQGFFMAAVDGNTSVDGSLGGVSPALEGIYLSDGSFSTGVGAIQLYIRGIVAAYGGVSLQRDFESITNLTTPAEVFEYAPDQVLLFPSKISLRKINWKEVAP